MADPSQPPQQGTLAPGSFDRDTAVERLPTRGSRAEGADAHGADAYGADGQRADAHEADAEVLDGRWPSKASFQAEVSPDWRAGRGPHGGYLAALVLRALIETLADDRRAPRSLTIHYARSPKPGAVRIDTVLERAGRSLSTLSARMEQEGSLVAIALAAFSVPWSAPEINELQLPEVAPPEPGREAGTMLRYGAPPFTSHIVLQPRLGSAPFAGSEEPMEIGGWLGLSEPRAIDPLSLAFFSDALFSPPFVRMSERATSPTIDLTIHFRASLPPTVERDPDELCFARFRTGLLHEGFFEEDGVIWGADGSVLAQSRQLAILMALPNR